MHALDVYAFSAPGIVFWTVRNGQMLLGCGALKELSPKQGEIKPMRTASGARRRGMATLMLAHLLDVARGRGYERVSIQPAWMAGRRSGSGSFSRMISRTTGAVSPCPSSR